MRSKTTLHLDDYLLDLVHKRPISTSRFGVYITALSLVLLFALAVSLTHFIVTESRKAEAQNLDNILRTAKHDTSVKLTEISDTLIHVSKKMDGVPTYLDNCATVQPIFERFPALIEVSIITEAGDLLQGCANPSAYGELNRPKGVSVLNAYTLQAMRKAQFMNTAIFSAAYTDNRAVASPFVDVAIPMANTVPASLVGRISLAIVHHSHYSLIGPERSVQLRTDDTDILGDELTDNESLLSVSTTLPPLPSNVVLTISSHANYWLNHSRLMWGVFGLIAILLVAFLAVLRFQYRQMHTQDKLSTRILLQQSMSQAFSDGICVTDTDGRILFVNAAFETHFGYKSDEILSTRPPYPYWPKPDITRLLGEFAKRPTGDMKPADLRFIAQRKNGSRFDCYSETRPILDADNTVLGYLIIYHDETETNQAKQSVAQAYDSVKRILGSIDAAVSVVGHDENGAHTLFANLLYIKSFGQDATAHVRLRALYMEPSEIDSTKHELFDEVTQRWFLVKFKTITWVDGSDVDLMTATDITKRKKARSLIDEQLKNAEQSARLITMGEMASSLAHELNQPLAAIQNYASGAQTLSKAGKLKATDIDEAFNRIITQTQRAAQIMKHIRSYAKHTDPAMVPTNVVRIVDGALELARIAGKKLGIKIDVYVDENLPEILCDAVLIEQVLLNLLRNAMEASLPTESRRIALRVTKEQHMIVFSIIDNGTGIPQDIKSKLFTPFFTTKPTGMGIGLNICRTIVETHQGRLIHKDNPEGGTTFKLSLPMAPNALQSQVIT